MNLPFDFGSKTPWLKSKAALESALLNRHHHNLLNRSSVAGGAPKSTSKLEVWVPRKEPDLPRSIDL